MTEQAHAVVAHAVAEEFVSARQEAYAASAKLTRG